MKGSYTSKLTTISDGTYSCEIPKVQTVFLYTDKSDLKIKVAEVITFEAINNAVGELVKKK